MKWLILLLLFSSYAFALETQEPEVPIIPEVEITKKKSHTATNREYSMGSVMVGHQVITSWIPFKWTLSYTQILNKKWSVDLELSRGSYGIGAFGFDAASVKEHRYSLMARRYWANSFNFIFGVFKQDFHAELGNKIVRSMSQSSIDDFRVQGLGVALGIGNRWQWQNGFTAGIDWFRINIPLFEKKVDAEVLERIDDDNDFRVVKNSIQKVKNLPTFVIFGINLGYTF